MFGLAALLSLISQVSGTPYIPGGDTGRHGLLGAGVMVANVASGRPAFGSRFNTGNMESALLARGFHYGTAPNSVVIGWNGGHAAVTLPDGTPVSSGEQLRCPHRRRRRLSAAVRAPYVSAGAGPGDERRPTR